jgi:DNA-binding winged helix-turn-helix (wHTH) protein
MSESPVTQFGLFTFDPHTGSLWRGTELLPLQPKDAAVLHVLLQHAGQVVPREALLEAVWPETYVTETVLKNRINRLRRLLGDDLKSPHYIETRHRRGYRFIGQLRGGRPAGAERSPDRTAAEPGVLPPAVVGPVGRQQELEQLHSWLAQALGGQRRVVFVTGEAGIGKTTLVEAFLMQVAAMGGVWIAHGQCVEHFGAGEAYRPVLEALDRLCRGPGGTRLVEVLRREAPTWLAQLPGLLSTAEAEALQRLLRGTTQARMLRELGAPHKAFNSP